MENDEKKDSRPVDRLDFPRIMHPRTLSTLAELEKPIWFSRVGISDMETAVILKSWEEAIEHCEDHKWQDLQLEATNQYCERLFERSRERFNQWNDLVDEVKLTTEPLVLSKIEGVSRQQNLPPIFEQTVQWDVLHVCMEAEYADVCPPGFFASQAYWYIKGHFPCGWRGRFPDGKIIIY